MSSAAPESRVVPHGHVARGTVVLPGSKSVAQRLLVLASLAEGTSTLHGITPCSDVNTLLGALDAFGVVRHGHPPHPVVIEGTSGRLVPGRREIDVGNNGTALRFLTAIATLRDGATIIHADRRRPVGGLVRALQSLGAWVLAATQGQSAPMRIEGQRPSGGQVRLVKEPSSQTVSALLLIAPFTTRGVSIEIVDELVSSPYVDLTIEYLRRFGYVVQATGSRRYRGPGSCTLAGGEHRVEGDASAAAFYLSAAAISGGDVTTRGVGVGSSQGDVAIVDYLEQMGCDTEANESSLRVRGGDLVGCALDMSKHPDLVPPLAAVAAFAAGPTRFSGIRHLRVKESDRISVLASGLRRVGCSVDEGEDFLEVQPRGQEELHGVALDPHDDHRMAMAFALLGLRIPGLEVRNSSCVDKSDPEFFTRLFRILE